MTFGAVVTHSRRRRSFDWFACCASSPTPSKGKGRLFMENRAGWHGKAKREQAKKALAELEEGVAMAQSIATR